MADCAQRGHGDELLACYERYMRRPFKPATFGAGSIAVAVALAGRYGVVGGARAEWQVPLCAAGLISGAVGAGICIIILSLRGARWFLRRVR